MRNPYSAYTDNSIQTASQNELTLMLYEGAIKFGNQALIALERKDYVEANRLNQRVQDIVRELQITLNRKTEIAENMYALYDYIYRLLVESNMAKDEQKLTEAIDLLREFRDMWKEAMATK